MRNMTTGAPFLIVYSVVSTIVTVVLSILYHSCGKSQLEGNKGTIEERTEIELGLINQSYGDQECRCESNLPISILEAVVLIVLACTGICLLIKSILYLRKWWTAKGEAKKQQKERKALKMQRQMIEEYKARIETSLVTNGLNWWRGCIEE